MLSRPWCTDRELGLPRTGEEEFLTGFLGGAFSEVSVGSSTVLEPTVRGVHLGFKASGPSPSNTETINKMQQWRLDRPTLRKTSECTLHV